MDAQTAVLVGLDELNNIIDRLHGRVLTQRIRVRQDERYPVITNAGRGRSRTCRPPLRGCGRYVRRWWLTSPQAICNENTCSQWTRVTSAMARARSS